jgi:hypothetical protein
MSAPASRTAAKRSWRSSSSSGDQKERAFGVRRTLQELDQALSGHETAETWQWVLANDVLDVRVERERRSFFDDHELASNVVSQDVAYGQRHLPCGLADGDDVDRGAQQTRRAQLGLDQFAKIQFARPRVTDGECVL